MTFHLNCQVLEDQWLLGYSIQNNPSDSLFGLSILTFNEGLEQTYLGDAECNFDLTSSSLLNKDGKLVLYTNGMEIYDGGHIRLQSEDGIIGRGDYWDINITLGEPRGLPINQGSFFIPESDSLVHLFSCIRYSEDLLKFSLIYHKLQLNSENQFEFVVRDSLILSDVTKGGFTACKHANGRDWWIAIPSYDFGKINSLYFEKGKIIEQESIDLAINQGGFHSARFSSDGRYFTVNSAHGQLSLLTFFDFNRCSGYYSQIAQDTFAFSTFANGIDFSVDNRYLYASNGNNIFQYDLQSEDIIGSRKSVGLYDGTEYDGFWDNNLGYLWTAPNGKIYCVPGSSSNQNIHVLHSPHKRNKDSNFENNALWCNTVFSQTVPNQLNLKLGPVDGSECDTLGIDNIPVSKFRIAPDSVNAFKFEFVNLSYGAPEEWKWTFGDNSSSQALDPVHAFEENGNYEICLEVSNQFGIDISCKTLSLDISDVVQSSSLNFQVFPNPVQNTLSIKTSVKPNLRTSIRLNTLDGKLVVKKLLSDDKTNLNTSTLDPGIYLLSIEENGKMLFTKKIIKL